MLWGGWYIDEGAERTLPHLALVGHALMAVPQDVGDR